MKNLIINVVIAIMVMVSYSAKGQTTEQTTGQRAELTVEVKGIKEAKGQLLIAVKSCDDPQKTVFEKISITEIGEVSCLLKNLPVGKVDISAFQDLNNNFQLEMDEELRIPIEPCYSKEKHSLREGENRLTIKLVNVKEMMGK